MPSPTTYICAKCSFKHSTIPTWGSYSYVYDGELIPVNRRVAICYTCDNIISAEVLPDPERIKELEERDGFIMPSFIENEKRRLGILKDRTTKARCLDCGSHDFEFIPYVEPDKERALSGTPVRTGLFHRGCGGRIYADFDTPNLFMGDRLPHKYFDLEGVEIEKSSK